MVNAMKASVEILSGVVRAGPDHDAFGSPYEIAVAFSSSDGQTAVLKGLTNPMGKLRREHVKAAVAALAKLGLKAKWDRVRRAPR